MRSTKRSLRERAKRADEYAEQLRQENCDLKERLSTFLLAVYTAQERLVTLFGPVEFLGPDKRYVSLRFRAEDGRADIAFNPANGDMDVVDPKGVVPALHLVVDPHHRIKDDQRKSVWDFRASVQLSRDEGENVPKLTDRGAVFLVTRRSELTA